MSTMANEEETTLSLILVLSESASQTSVPNNQSLVSALSACNMQPSSNALVVRPPSGAATDTSATFDPPTQASVTTAAQAFPTTNVKLKSILKK